MHCVNAPAASCAHMSLVRRAMSRAALPAAASQLQPVSAQLLVWHGTVLHGGTETQECPHVSLLPKGIAAAAAPAAATGMAAAAAADSSGSQLDGGSSNGSHWQFLKQQGHLDAQLHSAQLAAPLGEGHLHHLLGPPLQHLQQGGASGGGGGEQGHGQSTVTSVARSSSGCCRQETRGLVGSPAQPAWCSTVNRPTRALWVLPNQL